MLFSLAASESQPNRLSFGADHGATLSSVQQTIWIDSSQICVEAILLETLRRTI
jgi:hypothetical protein